jgi:Phage portal protein
MGFFSRATPPRSQFLVEGGRTELPPRGSAEILASYSQVPELRAVVHHTAQTTAAVKWRLYRATNKSERSTWTEVERHPFLDLIEQPNQLLGGKNARQVTVAAVDLVGSAGWVLVSDNPGQLPIAAYPVPGTWITHRPTADEPYWSVKGPTDSLSWDRIEPEDFLFFCDPDPANPYGPGTGIGHSLASTIDTAVSSRSTTAAFFANNALPASIVTIDGASADQAKATGAEWRNRFQGFRKAFSTLFTSAKVSVVRLDTSFRDQNLIEIQSALGGTIHRAYTVPPEQLGTVIGSNRQGSDAADRIDAKNNTIPRLELLRGPLQILLDRFEPSGQFVVEYDSPIPDDLEQKRLTFQAFPGAFSIDEQRELVDLPPLPNGVGRARLVPTGLVEVGPAAVAPPVQLSRSHVDRRELTQILSEIRASTLIDAVSPAVTSVYRHFGGEALAAVAEEDRAEVDQFDPQSPRARTWIRQKLAETAKFNTKKTRELVDKAIGEAVARQAPLAEIRGAVEQVFQQLRDLTPDLAERLTTSTSQAAEIEGLRQSGLEMRKDWLDTADDRTREAHVHLGGLEPIELDAKFVIPSGPYTGYSTDHPGGFGVPALDANCRCAIATVITDPKKAAQIQARSPEFAIFSGAATQEQRDAAWLVRAEKRSKWASGVAAGLAATVDAHEAAVICALELALED